MALYACRCGRTFTDRSDEWLSCCVRDWYLVTLTALKYVGTIALIVLVLLMVTG